MKTRNQWLLQHHRQVKRGEKPAGWLSVTVPAFTHHEEQNPDGTVTKWTTQETKVRKVPLYSHAQTKPYQRICGTVLRALYTGYFISGRSKYIWWTDKHWVTCKNGYLDTKKIKQHIDGKEIYGIRSGENANTNCVVVDLDLHAGSKEVVLRQLRLLLNHFHGTRKTHYSISPRGVHIIVMLDKPTPIEAARAWLRKELESIDTEELKELALSHQMRPISELEIKPSTKDGWRLPFARGRVTYTDEPLSGSDPKTFEKYVLWLVKPTYVAADQVYDFISGQLVEEEKKEPKPKKARKPKKVAPKVKKDVVLGSLGKMKNCYRQRLVEFWEGKLNPADTLNTAIVLTARMLPFYFDDEDDAVEFIEKLVDDLPDASFSDRLECGDRKGVSRVIRNTVRRVFDANGGQPRVDESNWKLAQTKRAWDRAGFVLTDRATWGRASSSLGEYFNFTSASQIKALGYLAGILKTDIETCANATRQIIRIAYRERQLPVAYFAAVLKSFGICVRHDGRVNEYVNTLRGMRWLVKLRESSADDHRARLYVTGDEFLGSVEGRENVSSNSTPHTQQGPMLSVPPIRRRDSLEAAMNWKTPSTDCQESERPPPLPIFDPIECCV